MADRHFSYVQMDVFASRPLEGNQLAVFTDATGLSSEEMQALARETNLSETTFILPRAAEVEAAEGVKVRIFTTQEELRFAGHPTLGTGWYLAASRGVDAVTLDLPVGKIPLEFRRDNGRLVFGEMRQKDPVFGQIHDPETAAKALGLEVSELDPSAPVQTVSTGMAFAIVPLRSLKTLQTFSLYWPKAAEYLKRTDAKFFYLVCRETIDREATLHARMIFYNGEDPATGSAAGCCTGWAVRHGVLASEKQGMIEQGIEMLRPSKIYMRAKRENDFVVDVRIGGSAVQVFRGEAVLGIA
ncbi:MAG: PhzF family phenazine biosynthesis protein [Terriglobia bacterium]|jgi:trans-2,3-dihydro-3-hydroxyanthranilate isomerase|nr:PhzF family phenazine biosynthesis protein [Terriglobia bacterium]